MTCPERVVEGDKDLEWLLEIKDRIMDKDELLCAKDDDSKQWSRTMTNNFYFNITLLDYLQYKKVRSHPDTFVLHTQ